MDKIIKVLLKSVFINTILVIFKIIIGFMGSSKALIANAIHSLSDLTTDIISIVGYSLSKKKASKKHPLGYGQIEYLTNIIVGVVIIFLAIETISSAFNKDVNIPSNIILVTSVISAIVKYLFSSYMLKKGNEYKNSILIVSGIESKADSLTGLLVVLSVLLSKLSVYNDLYSYSDNFCTFIIGVYILYIAIKILKDNIVNIIGKNEDNEDLLNYVTTIVLDNKQVEEILDLSIIRYGAYYVATIEIELDKNIRAKEINELKTKIRKKIINKKTNISYLTISVNYKGSDRSARVTRSRDSKKTVKE